MSHVFVMEWAAVMRDIIIGLLIADAVAAWMPMTFWENFFFTDHPVVSAAWGPLIGPIVSMPSFVCSIGNVSLAAVLWNGGISFGGVIAFIFAVLRLTPTERDSTVLEPSISWNCTAVLNLLFLALAAALLMRFFHTGGRQMLATMNGTPDNTSGEQGAD